MRIEGQELLSRGTVTAGRILETACVAVLLAWYFEVDTSSLSILGVALPTDELGEAFAATIGFLFVGYAVNWIGDVIAFQKWNKGEHVGGASLIGQGGSPLRTEISNLLVRTEDQYRALQSKIEREEGAETDVAALLRLLEKLKEIERGLGSLKQGVSRLSTYGRLLLYGWHGLMPLGLVAATLWVLLCNA